MARIITDVGVVLLFGFGFFQDSLIMIRSSYHYFQIQKSQQEKYERASKSKNVQMLPVSASF